MNARTAINTQYLMTLHAPLESPQVISSELKIHNVRPGGWIRGPHIQGDVVSPSADWLHVMPTGTKRLDVRLSIRADDQCNEFPFFLERRYMERHPLAIALNFAVACQAR
jgi:hypothetical protein